jgi:amidase
MVDDRVAVSLGAIALRDDRLRAFLAVDWGAAERHPAMDGPLRGMPMAVKDAFRTRDLPTTFGTSAQVRGRDHGADAIVVTRLRAAGATVVGKTNCGELCIGDYVLRGAPLNPRAPERSVSGSSGGCAAAVAAGLVEASVATDTGGSVRIPAAFCGVYGLKLTTGRVPMDGAVPLAPSLDCVGVLAASTAAARRVAATLLERELSTHPGAVRLAVTRPDEVVDPTIAEALANVARATGAPTVAPVDRSGWQALHVAVVGREAAAVHGEVLGDAKLGDETRAFLEAGQKATGARAYVLDATRFALRTAFDASLRGADVLVTPAIDGPPPVTPPRRGSDAFWRELEWLAPVNHTGHPALVVPIPTNGPPVALQLVARRDAEASLLAAAEMVTGVLRGGDARLVSDRAIRGSSERVGIPVD